MLRKFENYRFEGEMHRSALLRLPQIASLTVDEKNELKSAYKYGKWLGIGIQFPFVVLTMVYFNKIVSKLTPEKKMLNYTLAIGLYGGVYMFSNAWAWHQAHYKVESTIKKYIQTADIEEIKKIHEEQSLGITKDTKVYLPKEET
jgi:hypothetical protein